MFNYILKRLLLMIPTLFGILFVTFAIIQFVPGGPVEQIISQLEGKTLGSGEVSSSGKSGIYQGAKGLEPQQIEQLKAFYGFDKPPAERFVEMVKKYLVFDLGDSYFQSRSVSSLIASKLPVSISLGIWTFFLTYLICIPLGIQKAIKEGTPFDVVTSTVILIGYAIPGFMLAIFMLVLLGGGSFWDVFPLRGLTSDNWQSLSTFQKITDYLWHITLPVLTMMVGNFAVMTLLTKNSFLEEIRKQYVYTARAKGLTEQAVFYKHVFRNALIPIITGFPSAFIGAFFTGSLLVETVFSLDGLGLLSYESILKRDYPVVLGSLYIFTLIGLIGKLLSDLSYVLVDPRIQFESIK
jgi:microcin C transport system permease protein